MICIPSPCVGPRRLVKNPQTLLWLFQKQKLPLFCERQAGYNLVVFPFVRFYKAQFTVKMFCYKISRLIG